MRQTFSRFIAFSERADDSHYYHYHKELQISNISQASHALRSRQMAIRHADAPSFSLRILAFSKDELSSVGHYES